MYNLSVKTCLQTNRQAFKSQQTQRKNKQCDRFTAYCVLLISHRDFIHSCGPRDKITIYDVR